MPKKKAGKSKKSNNLLLVFFIVAVVTVLYMAKELQEKDKQLKQFKAGAGSANTTEDRQSDTVFPVKKHILTKEQEIAARKQIKDNLEAIIGQKPKMADKWFLSDIKFKDNGTVTLFYEDGHEAGEIVLKITDPANYTTWQKTGSK